MRECIIHGNRISGWDALYDQLSEELALPEWFGRNLDALYDCLTMIFEPTTLVIRNWSSAARRLGEYADRLWHVLDDASTENPFLSVEIC